jgi:ubiquinone/menaquinone biosynthesis C-methylase UbiE
MNWKILLVSIIDKLRTISENPHKKLQEIGVKEGMVFLDVGCTLGFYSFPASQLVGENGLVYALDINSQFLQRIENKARKTGRSNIKTIKADACETGLPNASVDTVFLHLVLHDIKDKEAAIKDFYRISKKQGRLVIDEENIMPLEDIKKLAEDAGFTFSKHLYKTIQTFQKR